MTRILSTFCLLFLVAVTAATAATAATDDDVRSIPLILHPAAVPSPALKYPLLPELRDTIPGNAVTHYRQALKNMKQDAPPRHDWDPAMDKWLAVPLKDLPREEVGKFLKQCETTFQEVEAGARSEQCDWELTERLRKKGISVLLPDVQEMRALAVLLQLRIRYELATGHTDKAVGTLCVGFALARHVADQPTLICALVGVALAAMMENRLEEVIQQPDAPNLYWSLTDLPRPFIDMRKPIQGDRVMAYGSFPGMAEMVADLKAKPLTPEQAEKFISEHGLLYNVDNSVLKWLANVKWAKQLTARHEVAKKLLKDQGRPKELVDAMPHLQVAMLDSFLQYDRLFDSEQQWQSLPFWEARPSMEEANKRADKELAGNDGPAIPLAKLLFPAMLKVVSARTRVDRHIAALRCVETVRLYTAAHEGKLPSSLEELKNAPAPLDPVTGKAFNYRVVGDRAFLSCTPFPGQPADNANTPTYELSIQR
jgi:hypothetical protein